MKNIYEIESKVVAIGHEGMRLPDREIEGIIRREVASSAPCFLGWTWDAENEKYIAPLTKPYLVLTTNATDSVQPFDGVPDIVAESGVCIITATKTENNEPVGSGTETVYFSATAGRLTELSKNLVNGQASVQFKAGIDTVLASITAWTPGGECAAGSIQIQVRP